MSSVNKPSPAEMCQQVEELKMICEAWNKEEQEREEALLRAVEEEEKREVERKCKEEEQK